MTPISHVDRNMSAGIPGEGDVFHLRLFSESDEEDDEAHSKK